MTQKEFRFTLLLMAVFMLSLFTFLSAHEQLGPGTLPCSEKGRYVTADHGKTWAITNLADFACPHGVGLMDMPTPAPRMPDGSFAPSSHPAWASQRFIDFGSIRLEPGASGVLTLETEHFPAGLQVPLCGRDWQADFYGGITNEDVSEDGQNIHPSNPNRIPNDSHAFGQHAPCGTVSVGQGAYSAGLVLRDTRGDRRLPWPTNSFRR